MISRLIFAIVLLGGVASTQPAAGKPVEAVATIEPAAIPAGGKGLLKIQLKLVEGAHANSNITADPNLIPTSFTPKAASGVTWGKTEYPDPKNVVEWYSTDPLSVFLDGAVLLTPFTLDKSAVGGLPLGGVLQVQVCDHEQCYPARRLTVTAQIRVQGSGKATAPPAPSPTNASANAGASAIDFAFTDFAGKKRNFREYRGRVVLIDFWATWCKPCLADIPHLKDLYTKYRAAGFDILGMDAESLGQEPGDIDAALLKDQERRARQIVSDRGAVWSHGVNDTAVPVAVKLFAAKTLPTKILVDSGGRVAARIQKVEELDALIPGLLNAKR